MKKTAPPFIVCSVISIMSFALTGFYFLAALFTLIHLIGIESVFKEGYLGIEKERCERVH